MTDFTKYDTDWLLRHIQTCTDVLKYDPRHEAALEQKAACEKIVEERRKPDICDIIASEAA